jgi:type IV pilus assembly protein PilY1
MNIATGTVSKRARLSSFLALLGLFLALAIPAARSAPTLDQAPLTVQKPLPPDIVLMLDDSGSMAWNFMPDICYLYGVSCSTSNGDYYSVTSSSNDALISSTINGVYYNPTVNYVPPTKADGTSYPAATGLTSAWVDGFASPTTAVDLTQYNGAYESYFSRGGAGTGASQVDFNTSISTTVSNSYAATQTGTQTSTYDATLVCPSRYSVNRNNQCSRNGSTIDPTSSSCPSGGTFQSTYGSGGNTQYNQCVLTSPVYTCSQGDTLSGTSCTHSQSVTYYYFWYTTAVQSGSSYTFTEHYVAPAAQGCVSVPSSATCVIDSDSSGSAAPSGIAAGQNIANWFAYYHTRILMAKSGLMIAFASLDPTTRLGFGSIDGGGRTTSQLKSVLGSDYYAFTTSVTGSSYNSGISLVTSFGDGSSGTQKANFWNWIASEQASGGTPLRMALDNIGKYYQTSTTSTSPVSPWQDTKADGTTEFLACRQAYAILTTDGFWNDSYSGVGNVDGTNGTATYSNNLGQSYVYKAVAPYTDSQKNTLADVASYYWQSDLQPNIDNEVPSSTADPAFWQHMTTFTVGLGFTPTGISPSSATVSQIFTWANGGASISGFSWPTPASNSIYNIADLAHAAVDGHGGFYSATSPQTFASGIADALNRAVSRAGTGASLASNSAQLQAGDYIYQSFYYTSTWVGDLQSFQVNTSDGSIVANSNPPSAASAMPAPASRNVYTYNPAASSNNYFQFNTANLASLSAAEQKALGATAAAQQSLVNYLLGDASNEQQNNGAYRDRLNTAVSGNPHDALGDIIDSQPVFVGSPNANLFNNLSFTGSSAYSGFATGSTVSSRTQVIWVAANDGMLHAFETSDLKEIYAYLPAAVLDLPSPNGIANLSLPAYGTAGVSHQDYNDGLLTVADAYFNSKWHTVLVGTTGRGLARAVYALDITSLTAGDSTTTPTLLWERSAADGIDASSPYIGQMTGQPVIAQTANGKWSVLMGNGYNSTAVSGGTAALLQFDLASGALTVYKAGSGTGNGLSSPSVWIANASNAISTTAYAGDLLGNVYSFDLTNPGSDGTAIFSTGSSQPVTGGMLAGEDPATGNIWLYFGTGQYLSQGDIANVAGQTWYGIIVQSGPGQTSNSPAVTAGTKLAALTQRTITAGSATSSGLGTRTISSAAANDMAGSSGWYINLPTQGERMVTPNQFQGRVLVGTTRIPVASDPCSPGGSGWIMAIDPFTGAATSSSFFPGYATSALGFGSVPNNPIFIGDHLLTSFDNATKTSVPTAPAKGVLQRMSWREFVAH